MKVGWPVVVVQLQVGNGASSLGPSLSLGSSTNTNDKGK